MSNHNKHKILNDPVYGFITIQHALSFDLMDHPYVQRLRRISQLGLSHLVYPGAVHNRFHHAIGALHLMQEAIAVLRAKGTEISESEAEGACAAILLHDIGHYTNEFPEDALEQGIDNLHDEAGAAVLAPFFPTVVTDCVRYHVAAKRYLCATDDAYFGRLSAASVHTLGLQGGPMDSQEVEAFASNPNLDAILQVRIWDDQGKVPGEATPAFAHYAPMLQRVVDAHVVREAAR